ncbi:hypothetical protein COOONC_27288 [Cooperia oncophora]
MVPAPAPVPSYRHDFGSRLVPRPPHRQNHRRCGPSPPEGSRLHSASVSVVPRSPDRALTKHGYTVHSVPMVQVRILLVKSSAAANPIYEFVAGMRIFPSITVRSRSGEIIETIFSKALGTSDLQYLRDIPPAWGADSSFLFFTAWFSPSLGTEQMT